MSKKKNTLKDLDEFLKQQAASIVEPAKLSGRTSANEPTRKKDSPDDDLTLDEISKHLKALSQHKGTPYRKELYDFVIHSLESLDQSLPEDKMLINTALYLKSGDQWKEVIRKYWRKKD
ncbi:MAG TPA: hypothetical protein VFW11_08225 [Cyclobacteriaceae bacterium]|nr:hypothetical protein [Cyclobacteriaceae bacterium]